MSMPRQRAERRTSSEAVPATLHPDDALAVLRARLRGDDDADRFQAVHELGDHADAHPHLRGEAVATLCAFLREPWRTPAHQTVVRLGADPSPGEHEQPDERDRSAGRDVRSEIHLPEAELRRAALGVLAAHLRRPGAATSWCGQDIDLAGAVLAGADFSGCWFTGGQVRLEGAWCVEGRLSFSGARFSGGHVSLRHWTSGQGDLDFSGARFTGGVVSLAGAVLDEGTVSFAGAIVDGGVVHLTEARLRGATLDLSGLTVTRGTLSLADTRGVAGRILLVDARLLGGVTALRDADLAPGMLTVAGAQATPGALMVRGARGL